MKDLNGRQRKPVFLAHLSFYIPFSLPPSSFDMVMFPFFFSNAPLMMKLLIGGVDKR